MSNSLKQLGKLMVTFIDRSLIPAINSQLPQSGRAIDQWKQLKGILLESETLEVWKVELFVRNMTPSAGPTGRDEPERSGLSKIKNVAAIDDQKWRNPKASDSLATELVSKSVFNPAVRNGPLSQDSGPSSATHLSDGPFRQEPPLQNSAARRGNGNESGHAQLSSSEGRSRFSHQTSVQLSHYNDDTMRSFEGLLASFQKMCVNFQNNHKKLVGQRDSLTQS